ncbi:MAG TPA: gluconeogenesis factor YvcK family protein [Acidimicrobiia bacterium]|nr:gluconeogenesis factor YvcK family protein [Acidimicrobiia bacterium]
MADRAPNIVALGGGHGLSVALRAARRYAGSLTAVVSVADDGGSSGRLRRDLGVVPPGDLRKCLVALADPGDVWATAFEHRFGGTELGGHALGNLILVGLVETLGDVAAALDEAARLLGATGRVRPATTERVVLKAQAQRPGSGGGDGQVDGPEVQVEGQVAVMEHHGRIRRVELLPADVPAHPDAIRAIDEADQVLLAPGSLFTSLLPVLVVPEIRAAIERTDAQVVQVANLAPQIPETEGLDLVDHLRAVQEHDVRVDVVVAASDGHLAADAHSLERCGVEVVVAAITRPTPGAGDRPVGADVGWAHDPARLAPVLSDLLASEGRGVIAPRGGT